MLCNSICWILPAVLLKVIELLLSCYVHAQYLASQHVLVGILTDHIAPIVEVVGQVAQNVAHDLWNDIQPSYFEILLLIDLLSRTAIVLGHHVLFKRLHCVQTFMIWYPLSMLCRTHIVTQLEKSLSPYFRFLCLESVELQKAVQGSSILSFLWHLKE